MPWQTAEDEERTHGMMVKLPSLAEREHRVHPATGRTRTRSKRVERSWEKQRNIMKHPFFLLHFVTKKRNCGSETDVLNDVLIYHDCFFGDVLWDLRRYNVDQCGACVACLLVFVLPMKRMGYIYSINPRVKYKLCQPAPSTLGLLGRFVHVCAASWVSLAFYRILSDLSFIFLRISIWFFSTLLN